MAIRGDRGIYFGSGIETRDFKKDADEIRKYILSIQKEGEKMDLSPVNEMMDIQKKAIADLEKQYKSLGQQIENIQPGLAQQELVREHRKVGAAIEAEKQAMEAMKEAYKSFGDEQVKVRTRQREIRHELYALSAAGKDNTEEFRALVKELQGFDSAVDSVKSLQNTLRRGGVEMKAFVGTVRAGTGVFATMTGFMGLFAEQNERFAQIQTRLQSVLSISMGIEQTYNALLKEGQLIQSVRALQARAAVKAKNLETKSTIAATAAQRAYNAVAKANPYVLIAGLILSVVGALTLLTRRNREAANSMKEFNEKVADSMASSIVQVRLFSEQWKRMGDDVSRQDWIDRNKGAFNSLGIEINNVKDAETAFVTNTSTVVRAMELRAKATATQELAQEAYKNYLENTDKQIEINKKLVDRSIIQGLKTGWGRIFGADEPIDEANKSLERYNKLIVDAADLTLEADRLIASVDLAPKSSAKDKSKDKKEEKEREKTFKEMLDARKKIWEDYYEAVRVIGRKAADEIYKDDISAHESYLRELESRRDQMLEEGITTKKQVDQLNILNQTIQDLLKLDSPFEKQRKEIESSLSEIDTFTDKLKFLESQAKNLGTSFEDIEMAAYLKDQTDKIVDERQRMFDELMKAHRDYETKIKEIDARTSDLLSIATTPEQIKIIEDQAARQKYDAYIEMLKEKYEDLNMVFTDIAALSREKLIEFREIFEHELDKADEAAKKTEIAKVIKSIDDAIRKLDSRPLKDLVDSFKDFFDAPKGSSKRTDALKEITKRIDAAAKEIIKPIDDVQQAAENMGVTADDAFMKLLSGMRSTVVGAADIGKGIAGIGLGLASGNPLGVIQGISSALKGVTGIVGEWIKKGKQQESQFDRIRRKIDEMRAAYDRLQSAMQDVADGSGYAIQQRMLQNLLRQRGAIESAMEAMDTSGFKGRGGSDFRLTQEWKDLEEELRSVNHQIKEIINDITKDIFTTDAQDLASRLGDSLVDAFLRGEDAAEALRATVDDMFKQMIRNMVAAAMFGRIEDILHNAMRDMGIDPETGFPIKEGREKQGITRLSQEQMKKYRKDLVEAALVEKELLEGLSDILRGIIDLEDEELADPLRGAIQGMTQETADILAGQFNAIRMDTSGILTTLRNNQEKVDAKVIHLANIDANTARMYKEVKELNDKIKEGDVRSSGL